MHEQDQHNPFAPPGAADMAVGPSASIGVSYIDEGCLVVGHRALLPNICVHCGRTEHLSHRDRKLTWVNTLLIVLLLLLAGPLIVLIVYLVTRKTLTIGYTVCHDCAAGRRSRLIPPGALLMLSFAALVLGIVQVDSWGGFLIIGSIIAMFVSTIWLMVASQELSVKRYAQERFWVKGFSDDFFRAFESETR